MGSLTTCHSLRAIDFSKLAISVCRALARFLVLYPSRFSAGRLAPACNQVSGSIPTRRSSGTSGSGANSAVWDSLQLLPRCRFGFHRHLHRDSVPVSCGSFADANPLVERQRHSRASQLVWRTLLRRCHVSRGLRLHAPPARRDCFSDAAACTERIRGQKTPWRDCRNTRWGMHLNGG